MATSLQTYGKNGLGELSKYLFMIVVIYAIQLMIIKFLTAVYLSLGFIAIVIAVSDIYPKSEELIPQANHFIIGNRLRFWQPRQQFNFSKIDLINILTESKRRTNAYFTLIIVLKDGRIFRVNIYDNRWREVKRYFQQKGFDIPG